MHHISVLWTGHHRVWSWVGHFHISDYFGHFIDYCLSNQLYLYWEITKETNRLCVLWMYSSLFWDFNLCSSSRGMLRMHRSSHSNYIGVCSSLLRLLLFFHIFPICHINISTPSSWNRIWDGICCWSSCFKQRTVCFFIFLIIRHKSNAPFYALRHNLCINH